jgi:thymidylate synthase
MVGLPSCHNYMQFYVTTNKEGKRVLNTFCNIRSNDWFLGQPYNVVQYALLTHMIATVVEMDVGELVINAVDAHLYHEHFKPAKVWLERYEKIPIKQEPINGGREWFVGKDSYCKAKLTINNEIKNIDDFKFEDFELTNYDPQPYIKAKLLT